MSILMAVTPPTCSISTTKYNPDIRNHALSRPGRINSSPCFDALHITQHISVHLTNRRSPIHCSSSIEFSKPLSFGTSFIRRVRYWTRSRTSLYTWDLCPRQPWASPQACEDSSNGAVRRSVALAPGIEKADPKALKKRTQRLLPGRRRLLDEGTDKAQADLPLPQKLKPTLNLVRQQLRERGGSEGNAFLGLRQVVDKVGNDAEEIRTRFKEQRVEGLKALRKKSSSSKEGEGADAPVSFSVDPFLLSPGEYVVHKKVGIGRFVMLRKEKVEGKEDPVTYVFLKYADGMAKLSAHQARKLLYRFRSPGEIGRPPPLNKLKDTTAWERRKAKGHSSIQRLVVEMMELYVYRLKHKREVYPDLGEAMVEFGKLFPYEPTPDQQQAFDDVAVDMTLRETPMDRLICGDVGFGKTEVALRAIFQAVMADRQVMVLAPTTVLAKQHFKVISARFKLYPGVRVGLLSRFQKENERREVLEGISNGTLHVVAGTHALLGSQVRYQNLGLLIVDEEQRFGVRQKERITSLKTSVDVLTLSATPIPRTLYMALNGFRDASLIATPPPERRPIQTHLMQYSRQCAFDAIRTEVARGGQVFYVVPRVQGIGEIKDMLQGEFPELTFNIAHGKQSPEELEEAMEAFSEGKTSVLLCTTIIESGLDISSVNTIIVEDVHLFGLAQLYQLRGRVGRADKDAHAYMFHPNLDDLSSEALERLKALEQCCGLGQGFMLAERDMAIRGIGNIFGEKQSGDAIRVGLDLYMEMLQDSLIKVEQQRLPVVEFSAVKVDFETDTHIPREYVSHPAERAQLLLDADEAARTSLVALVAFTDKLRHQYGPEPPTVEMFLKMLSIRRMAASLGIHRIQPRSALLVVLETGMDKSIFEMLHSNMTAGQLSESLHFKPGRIELHGLIEMPSARQLERVFLCLIDMYKGLPNFVQYI